MAGKNQLAAEQQRRESAATVANERPKVPRLKMVNAAEVQEEQLSWLWSNRFLIGHVNIIAGDPGLGKSMLAIQAAAHVSTGRTWPDGTPCGQGHVIYATTEDGYADTVKPRLSAAHADHSNITFLQGVEYPDGEGPVFLDEHIAMLDWHLTECNNVRLLVLDTLQSFVGERVNTNNNSSSRRVMTPLKRLAERHRVAVLCIEHLTKSSTQQSDNATYRVQGSIAFTGSARAVWIVCRDPDDRNRRILQSSKTNLAADNQGHGVSYQIAGPTGRPFIQWGETNIATPISELLSGSTSGGENGESATEFQRACDWLRAYLTEPCLQTDCRAGWRAELLSDATVRRAKKHLEIGSEQRDRQWFWVPSPAMLAERAPDAHDVAHLNQLFNDEHLTT